MEPEETFDECTCGYWYCEHKPYCGECALDGIYDYCLTEHNCWDCELCQQEAEESG
jgi:hypothetical protein